ncbi:MAG TPA: IS3 family transposase [Candidatus Acidoferrum sp.]|nr:IS3 family transposase [Candidatus Acidoferrum sp.]
MTGTRKRHSAAFKARVALEGAKQTRTLAELSRAFQVHPVQISQWKKQLLDGVESLFRDGRRRDHDESQAIQAELYEQIGRLKMEVEWLKKKVARAAADLKRPLIEPSNSHLSIRRQCELVGLNRSSYYLPPATESEENLRLMRLIDEQFLKTPFSGSRRMTASLERCGETVNRKRVQRLMAVMGLEALFPRPRPTTAASEAQVYPYLLRDRVLTRADEVWSSDITYVPIKHSVMYLTAVIDWYSRYVLSWRLSNTLEGRFCLEALEEALAMGRPEIFNTDQGSQFTARGYTDRLKEAGIAVSRDGWGRALDNVFVERLWRSVKYEDIYIKDYEQVQELESGLRAYFWFYDEERPHQSLDYRTPGEVYRAGIHGG